MSLSLKQTLKPLIEKAKKLVSIIEKNSNSNMELKLNKHIKLLINF